MSPESTSVEINTMEGNTDLKNVPISGTTSAHVSDENTVFQQSLSFESKGGASLDVQACQTFNEHTMQDSLFSNNCKDNMSATDSVPENLNSVIQFNNK